jgi:hypothetical protein
MLTFAYVPCAPQFPFGGDVSVSHSSDAKQRGYSPEGAKLSRESALKPVPRSIAPESLAGIIRPICSQCR